MVASYVWAITWRACQMTDLGDLLPEFLFYFLNILYWLCYYSYPNFPPFAYPHPVSPISSSNHPSLSSCPWVMHLSSLASSFPIMLLTSPCVFCAYQFVLLNPCTFSPIFPFPLPTGNPPCDLHIYDSVLLICLVCFLDSIVDSCEFIAILMFIVLISFFFLNKSF